MILNNRAYILLGSNINPIENMRTAIQLIQEQCTVTGISRLYETKPVKKENVPRYLNAVVCIDTDLDPVGIKHTYLRSIESKMGRERTEDKYKSRVIDLDLIMWGDKIYSNHAENIVLPDPEIVQYAHVAVPLADVAPDLMHPVNGLSMSTIANKFKSDTSINPVDMQIN